MGFLFFFPSDEIHDDNLQIFVNYELVIYDLLNALGPLFTLHL